MRINHWGCGRFLIYDVGCSYILLTNSNCRFNHKYRAESLMAASVFSDKSFKPDTSDLYTVLGSSETFLRGIEVYLKNAGQIFDWEWKFYGKKAGWTVACTTKYRRVFHLIPLDGAFIVVFTFGQKAVEIALEADLSDKVKAVIQESTVYAEGRSFRLAVTNQEDADSVIRLIKIKLEN